MNNKEVEEEIKGWKLKKILWKTRFLNFHGNSKKSKKIHKKIKKKSKKQFKQKNWKFSHPWFSFACFLSIFSELNFHFQFFPPLLATFLWCKSEKIGKLPSQSGKTFSSFHLSLLWIRSAICVDKNLKLKFFAYWGTNEDNKLEGSLFEVESERDDNGKGKIAQFWWKWWNFGEFWYGNGHWNAQ